MIAREALQTAAPSLRQLAAEEGWSYSTLKAYSAGIRTPSDEAVRELAAGLRRRAEKLARLARELEEHTKH